MDDAIVDKARHLTDTIRVMTLAIVADGAPWSAPVYFVHRNAGFYFFSNEKSRHIRFARDKATVAAAIFNDADQGDEIFGFQMSGTLARAGTLETPGVTNAYLSKFHFLKKAFGSQVLENPRFFLEKFKSRLYCFSPDIIYISDNSRPSGKRLAFDLALLSPG